MASDRFEIEPTYPEEKRGSGCLRGCLIAFVVVLALVLIAGLIVMKNWRGWVAGQMTVAIDAILESSDLPAQEQVEVKEQLLRVTDAFREGRISGEQFGEILQQLAESPLMASLVVTVAEAKYLSQSGLTEDEKVAARQNLSRFVLGINNGEIDKQVIDEVMPPIADRNADGGWELRNEVSDDQLREFLAGVKTKADEADIPVEVEEIDPSEQFRRIIDDVLGEVEAPAAEAPRN